MVSRIFRDDFNNPTWGTQPFYGYVRFYQFFPTGDIDYDGRVTSADSTAFARWIINDRKSNILISERVYDMDCNPKNNHTLADLTRLAQALVGRNNLCAVASGNERTCIRCRPFANESIR